MKSRTLKGHILAASSALALVSALILTPLESNAGIFRDVLESMHLAKPQAPPGPPPPTPTLPWQGFACCNLHYEKGTIDDGNYSELPMVPAGTPIEVVSYDDGRHRAYVKIDGKPMKLGLEYGREQESLEGWVAKLVLTADPRPRIQTYPPAVRDAIYEGKLVMGMTREQAIVAVGYPIASENITLDAPVWRVYRSRRGEYQLNFRPDGRLGSVTGDTDVTAQVIYQPGK
jgi:hypothetical protein